MQMWEGGWQALFRYSTTTELHRAESSAAADGRARDRAVGLTGWGYSEYSSGFHRRTGGHAIERAVGLTASSAARHIVAERRVHQRRARLPEERRAEQCARARAVDAEPARARARSPRAPRPEGAVLAARRAIALLVPARTQPRLIAPRLNGLAAATTSAPGLRPRLPHLQQDWAHACAGTDACIAFPCAHVQASGRSESLFTHARPPPTGRMPNARSEPG